MHGRVAALLLVGAFASSAIGQPAAPPPLTPSEPVGFLLPPVLPDDSSTDRPRPRATTPDLPPPPAAKLSFSKDITTVSAERVDQVRRAEHTPIRSARSDDVFPVRRPRVENERTADAFGDRVRDIFDRDKPRRWLQSDRAFDQYISPVTNPFLFEDPRSVTELRPIFIYQKIPSPQPNFQGGNIWFVGTQARIALTERFSITMNKLGITGVNSAGNSLFGDNTGLAEIWFGPKYTFIRDEEFGTLLAGGVQFQVPIGPAKVYQDTGSLSIVPYVSFAQPFFKTQLGGFNFIGSAGYSFATNRERSDYFYASGHLDFDIGNAHRFYPLVEMNWFQYTTDGRTRFIAGEGRDLINFGSLGKGSSLVTTAIGGRMKVGKNTEIGAAYEFPFVGNRDFFKHRFTVDFVWRF